MKVAGLGISGLLEQIAKRSSSPSLSSDSWIPCWYSSSLTFVKGILQQKEESQTGAKVTFVFISSPFCLYWVIHITMKKKRHPLWVGNIMSTLCHSWEPKHGIVSQWSVKILVESTAAWPLELHILIASGDKIHCRYRIVNMTRRT